MAKKTYVAVHEVHLTKKPGKAATAHSPAVPPEKNIIAPKTRFNLDTDAAAPLLALGAIKLATKEPVTEEDAPEVKEPVAKEPAAKAPAKKAPAKKAPVKKAPAKKTEDDKSGEDAAKDLL